MCICVHVCVHMHATAHGGLVGGQGIISGVVLSFYHVGLRGLTQADGTDLCQLNHLTGSHPILLAGERPESHLSFENSCIWCQETPE